MDECASKDEKICGPNAECQNLPGSYQVINKFIFSSLTTKLLIY